MTAASLKSPERAKRTGVAPTSRPILERNRVKYILARKGDTFEDISEELGKLSWELPRYNDISNPDSLVQGQIIYIQPKRNKAEPGKNTHTVKEGESMFMIAQLYAIKLEKLYAMNGMDTGIIPS
ncbi:MAG TPA: LysM domain-containing protein, partial [Bacteroidales bacterium]|nr:LysM domain-containing protein [Bacteroidales bacterium]